MHRVAGLTGARTAVVTSHPFRASPPPYTSSEVGLIGGGQVPMPSEVLPVHYGGLFLDEWPVHRRHILVVLWQPSRSKVHTAHLLHGVDLASCMMWQPHGTGSGMPCCGRPVQFAARGLPGEHYRDLGARRPAMVGIKGGDPSQFPLQRWEHATGVLERASTAHARECRDKRRGQGATGTNRSLERVSGADHGVGLASLECLLEYGQMAGIVLGKEVHQFSQEGRIATHCVQRSQGSTGGSAAGRSGSTSGSSRRAMAAARSAGVMGLAT